MSQRRLMSADLYRKTVTENPYMQAISPTILQQEFLVHHEEPYYLITGSNGIGKTTALILAALQFVQTEGYNALIIAPSFLDLKCPGGVMDKIHQMLQNTDAEYSACRHQWTFPASKSRLTVGWANTADDARRYMGQSYHYIGIVNGNRFDEGTYRALRSCLNSTFRRHLPVRMRVELHDEEPTPVWFPRERGERDLDKAASDIKQWATSHTCVVIPELTEEVRKDLEKALLHAGTYQTQILPSAVEVCLDEAAIRKDQNNVCALLLEGMAQTTESATAKAAYILAAKRIRELTDTKKEATDGQK